MLYFDHNLVNRPTFFEGREVKSDIEQLLRFMDLSGLERAQSDSPIESDDVSTRPTSLLENDPLLDEVKDALLNISNGLCAFCEGEKPNIQVYRLRPDYEAQPYKNRHLAHEYYQWLKWEWTNFYPICHDCHPNNFQKLFPVRGNRTRPSSKELEVWLNQVQKTKQHAIPRKILSRLLKEERPILFAPGQVHQYGNTFSINKDAQLLGKTNRATETIEHYNLNHQNTVERRRYVIQNRLDTIKELGPQAEFEFKSIEYGGAWYLTLKSIVTQMLKNSSVTGRAYLGDIQKTVSKLYNDVVWENFDTFVDERFIEYESITSNKNTETLIELSSEYEKGRSETLRHIQYSRHQPRLENISIKNFKSLQSINIDLSESEIETESDLLQSRKKDRRSPCLLMLGENATGKSSLLEAVTLAAIPKTDFEYLQKEISLKEKHQILNPKFLGSPEKKIPEFSKVELTFKSKDGDKEQRSLEINKDGFHHSVDSDSENFLIFAYGAHRLFGQTENRRPEQTYDGVITLFRNDVMTIDPEAWLIELDTKDPQSRDVIARALRFVIQLDGEFQNIEVQKDNDNKKFCQINLKRSRNIVLKDSIEEHVAHKTEDYIVPTPLKYVSSGYRVIIALICDVFKGIMDRLQIDAELARKVPVLILIDEIEAHLHPRWKLEIISGLRRALPAATFVMSSHDPLCIRGMKNGEVVVFNRFFNDITQGADLEELQTREMVEIIKEFPDFQTLTIEQILTSDLFQLYSPDDRRIEKEFSNIAQLLEREKSNSLKAAENAVLKTFRKQINKSLPIGMTEAERVVQEAVADYLALRRDSNHGQRTEARKKAKEKILQRLKEVAGDVNVPNERS